MLISANTIMCPLRQEDRPVPAFVFNDADVVAAGVAATRGHLDKLVRVWTLGNGVGFGRYPWAEGVWEGGHSVVTLDPKERFCGCGGVGHLEGIMGHRAMRLRFLDLEPEEIFENAKSGDARCSDFVTLWHRALAAATATPSEAPLPSSSTVRPLAGASPDPLSHEPTAPANSIDPLDVHPAGS